MARLRGSSLMSLAGDDINSATAISEIVNRD